MKKIILITLVILLFFGAGYLIWQKYFNQSDNKIKVQNENISVSGNPVTLTDEILNNKFGFLSAGGDEGSSIKEMGAGWIRPHPGPFLWDRLQSSATSKYDFTDSDELVSNYQDAGLGILATIWPFADWDQIKRANAADCKVSSQDEFLNKNNKKDRPDYLPEYRCNPNNWIAYQNWVKAMVERYDGDGTDDMAGLKYPIKHWEVMNEPDLDDISGRLDFYKQDAADYAELLIKTSSAIREADSSAQILIAGAAGGDENFLSFYEKVLAVSGVTEAFDIANVHCISNDDYASYNVKPYQAMLTKPSISKPIWVTEAQAILSSDKNINASQTYASTKKALELGAQRIFYTHYDFGNTMGNQPMPQNQKSQIFEKEVDGSDEIKAFQIITSL